MGLYTRVEPFLLPFFPRLIYFALKELGHHDIDIFAELSINADQLQDESYRLSIEQHEAFILRALELTGDPHLGIRLVNSSDTGAQHLALMAVANSGQISKALHLLTRYFTLVTRVFSLQPHETDTHSVLRVDVHLDHPAVSYFAVSTFVLFLDRFFQKHLKGQHLIERVSLNLEEPDDFDRVHGEFPFEVLFSEPQNEIQLNRNFLDQPMPQADPQTVRLLIEMTERQLEEAQAETTIVGAVRSLLIDQIASPPKLDEAARQLAISPRGLRRKLAAANTSYQKTLDDIRLKMATQLIRETNAPVASIAFELGFSNASDFGRAFKRWSGQTPASLRL